MLALKGHLLRDVDACDTFLQSLLDALRRDLTVHNTGMMDGGQLGDEVTTAYGGLSGVHMLSASLRRRLRSTVDVCTATLGAFAAGIAQRVLTDVEPQVAMLLSRLAWSTRHMLLLSATLDAACAPTMAVAESFLAQALHTFASMKRTAARWLADESSLPIVAGSLLNPLITCAIAGVHPLAGAVLPAHLALQPSAHATMLWLVDAMAPWPPHLSSAFMHFAGVALANGGEYEQVEYHSVPNRTAISLQSFARFSHIASFNLDEMLANATGIVFNRPSTLCEYWVHVMHVYERLAIDEWVCRAAEKALAVAPKEYEPRSTLWCTLYMKYMKAGDKYDKALMCICANDADMAAQTNCLRQYISTVIERRDWTAITKMNFGALTAEFEAILMVSICGYRSYAILSVTRTLAGSAQSGDSKRSTRRHG